MAVADLKLSETLKSEEDRIKLINSLPDDPPVGVDVDSWYNEQQEMIQAIQNHSFDEVKELTEEEKQIASLTQDNTQTQQDTLKPNHDVEAKERYIESLKSDMERMKADSDAKLLNMQSEFEKKLNELSVSQQEPIQPASVNSEKIKKIKEELILIDSRMSKIDDIFESQEYFKDMQKAQQLNAELVSIQDQNSAELKKQILEMNNKSTQSEKSRLLKEEEDRKKEAAKKSRNDYLEKISDFRNKFTELKGRSYSEQESDYLNFGKEAASVFYGKPMAEVTEPEIEKALIKYSEKVPSLIEGLVSRGVKQPADLKQFEMLSNIGMAMDGYELNKATGSWEKIKNIRGNPVVLPSFETAYNYIKEKTGQTGQELLNQSLEAVKNFANATQQRAGVMELGSGYQQKDTDEMTSEQAQRIIAETDDEDIVLTARRNPSSPKVIQYNKAASILGYEPVQI